MCVKMRNISNVIFILLLWMSLSIDAQSTYFRRSSYYSPVVAPPTRYYHHSHGFVPLTYSTDLLSEETKRKESNSKSYSKKMPFRPVSSGEEDFSSERFTSSEYSNESPGYNSKENDSREYTIGTQIRVQHPLSVPKKSSSHSKYIKYTSPSPLKSSYSDINLSTESRLPEPAPAPLKKHSKKYTQIFESDPFHLVPPPKSTVASSGVNYNVYEPDQEDYEAVRPSRSKTISHDIFKGTVSKKQLEKYLEDQEKMLDEALKIQLLNNPKFQQLLKAKEEELYEQDFPPNPTSSFHNYNDNFPFKPNRSRRRPQSVELKRSPNTKHTLVSTPKRRFRSALVINV